MSRRSILARTCLLGLAVPLLVVACGDDESHDLAGDGGEASASTGGDAAGVGGAGEANPQGTIIGPKGGVVVSDDGLLRLTVPAGALDTGTPISITAIDAEESTAALADTTLRGAYRFEPDGTEFAEPATLAYTLEGFVTDEDGVATVPMVVVTTESGGVVEAIGEQALDVNLDDGQAILSAPLAHFSQMAMNALGPGLDTLFFYVTFEPKLPSTMELGTDYGAGLFVHTKSVLARDGLLTYQDESTNLDYSEGTEPYEIAAFGGNADEPGVDIVPVGTYSCAAVGAATFSARLTTDPLAFVPFLQGSQGNGDPQSLRGEVQPPPSIYRITITSGLTCNEADTPSGGVDGPPYSGLVEYQLSLAEQQFNTAVLGAKLKGAFYGGGAAQADFDAWVSGKRRLLGLVADRLASGTCRSIVPEETALQNALPPNSTVTHVASGAADALAFSFPDTEQVEPVLVAWLAPQRSYAIGQDPPSVFEPSPSGIDVFVPAGAAAPSITMPGWDASTWQGFSSFRGEDGFEISWDAELIQAEHVHALIVGSSQAGMRITECFTEPAAQQLMIPTQTISDTFVPALDEEVPTLEVHMYSGSRAGVTYDGRTLEGIALRDTRLRY